MGVVCEMLSKMFSEKGRKLNPGKCIRARNKAFEMGITPEEYCKYYCKYNMGGECYCPV